MNFKQYYETEVLEEGLLQSYPPFTLKAYLHKLFPDVVEKIQIQTDDVFPVETNLILTLKDSCERDMRNDEEFLRAIQLYGYHIGGLQHNTAIQLEPLHPLRLSRDTLPQYAYHTTRQSVLEKIMKIGLTPRHTQTDFEHPGDRIYLYIPPNDSVKEVKKLHNMFRYVKDEPVTTLRIQLTSEYYYLDPNFSEAVMPNSFAVFTRKNIKPENISVVI
jgi:hypothetical protein